MLTSDTLQDMADDIFKNEAEEAEEAEEEIGFLQFSLNGKSEQMKKDMQNEVHIMQNIALLGQITVIYAKPNTGKTLLTMKLLMDAVKSDVINGNDLFYLNCDDTYRGLIEKIELAEKCGFHMLAPSHSGFEIKDFVKHMNNLIRKDLARGKIIVLDTLKKFTNLMDKNKSTDFMNTARSWATHGGSIILLAHTNKNRDGNGKAVAGGTSDIIDDGDCAYILDEVSHIEEVKSIMFENIKLRGDVSNEVAFTYSTRKGQTYEERVNSIEALDEEQTKAAKTILEREEEVAKDQPIIDSIIDALLQHNYLKSDLVKLVNKESGFSIRKINVVLSKYEGKNFFSDKWHIENGDKNTKIYTLLNNSSYH